MKFAIGLVLAGSVGVTGLVAQNGAGSVPKTAAAAVATAGVNAPAASMALIGPEDTIGVDALNVEEISKQWRVGASGFLNMPMVGSIKAVGKTVEELRQEIVERLRKYVIDPQVSLYVAETRSHPVTVSGAVDKPGVVQLTGPTPLFAVLLKAGGPKDTASSVSVMRKRANGPLDHPQAVISPEDDFTVVELPLKEVTQGFGSGANLQVIDNDVIKVTERRRLVHITGEVNRPGAVELVTRDTISLTQAVAIAGGLQRTASPGKVMLRHISNEGTETAVGFVDLKKIMSGRARDVDLTEGDIIIVPTNKVLNYMSTVSMSAVTTGLMVLSRY